MQYNSHATSQDIVTMAEKKCQANSVSFPIAEKTLYANEGSKIIWSWIHEAYGGWAFDDSNNTDFPESTGTINASQTDYAIPTDTNFVKGVSIKTTGNVWQKLEPITLEQIEDMGMSEAQFMNVASQPMYYRLLGNSIKLYPAPSYTQSSSIKIYYDRDITLFSTTDTTKTPGWATAYHEALATYMALCYAKTNQLGQAKTLQDDWFNYEKRIKSDYSRRFQEMFPGRITTRDSVREFQ